MSQFTDAEIFREAARRLAARRPATPRAKVLRPCPKCGVEFGTRELRLHKPKCKETSGKA